MRENLPPKYYTISLDEDSARLYECIAAACHCPVERILEDTLYKVLEIIGSNTNNPHAN